MTSRETVGFLPAELTSFVGRRAEVAEARRLLSTSRLVTLTGMGGVGKTRLAVRVASEIRRTFPDGVWFVDLSDLGDPALLPSAVAARLGVHDQASPWVTTVLTEFLAPRRLLLVLDNCEHLIDACATLASAVLRAAPSARILTTSRQPLSVIGERVLPVAPLPVSTPVPTGASQAFLSDAVALFSERAAAVDPGFSLDDDNAAMVTRLCVLLDGLPLAIELATSWLRLMSLDQIEHRLADRDRLLTRGGRGLPARHHTLQALMDWSHNLCTPAEQLLWSRLSVFASGFGLDAADAVCAGAGVDPGEVFDLVASLVDKSVLVRIADNGTSHYRLPETLRHYGQAKLDPQEGRRLRARHRDWYGSVVARAAGTWVGPDQARWIAWYERETANVRAALEFCLAEERETEAGLRIAADLQVFREIRGQLSEGRHWLERLLARSAGPTTVRARAAYSAGWLATLQHDAAAAEAHLDEARRLTRQLDDPVGAAYVVHQEGMQAIFADDLQLAADRLAASLAAFRSAGELSGELWSLFMLGHVRGFLGDRDGATEVLAECIERTSALGELAARSYALWALGIVTLLDGDPAGARPLEQQALRDKAALSDQLGTGLCLEALAWIAAEGSAYERAATLLGAADALWTAMGLVLGAGSRGLHSRCVERTKKALGEQAYASGMHRGHALPPRDVLALALDGAPAGREAPGPAAAEADDPLTPRQREIAELIGMGLTDKEIATRLVISQRTAEGHVYSILTRLGFTSRSQIATWVAMRRTSGDASS